MYKDANETEVSFKWNAILIKNFKKDKNSLLFHEIDVFILCCIT